jgi:hypothetical protein
MRRFISRNIYWALYDLGTSIIGVIFLVAAFSKVADASDVIQVLKYDGLSGRLINVILPVIILVEVAIGESLLLSDFRKVGLIMAIITLAVFTMQLIFLLWSVNAPSCGCLVRILEFKHTRTENWVSLIRNGLLMSVLISAFLAGRKAALSTTSHKVPNELPLPT